MGARLGLDRGAPDGLVGDDDALHFLGGHVHQVLEQLHGAHLGDGEAQGGAGVGERAVQGVGERAAQGEGPGIAVPRG